MRGGGRMGRGGVGRAQGIQRAEEVGGGQRTGSWDAVRVQAMGVGRIEHRQPLCFQKVGCVFGAETVGEEMEGDTLEGNDNKIFVTLIADKSVNWFVRTSLCRTDVFAKADPR